MTILTPHNISIKASEFPLISCAGLSKNRTIHQIASIIFCLQFAKFLIHTSEWLCSEMLWLFRFECHEIQHEMPMNHKAHQISIQSNTKTTSPS